MDTIWERVAHSVNRIFSLYKCLFVVLVVSHSGFVDWTVVLIVSVPGHCLPFTFSLQSPHLRQAFTLFVACWIIPDFSVAHGVVHEG